MTQLSTIILLTSRYYTKRLIDLSVQKVPHVAVIYVQHPNELLHFDVDFLKSSRLISFGSRFYVKPELLSLIGYGSYNFHPGPSNYPGWAPFNFAIYNDASKYGVTVHQMTPTLDSGSIIGSQIFDIPPDCSVQQIMDITTEYMYALYDELVLDFATRETTLPDINENWSGHMWTKRDFEKMCQIPVDITEGELIRRLHAFGEGDSINVPYIQLDSNRFEYTTSTDDQEPESLHLFGHRFTKK
jgi:methionyl-tRNA formyltransferase